MTRLEIATRLLAGIMGDEHGSISDPELLCKYVLKLADTLIRVAKETEEKPE